MRFENGADLIRVMLPSFENDDDMLQQLTDNRKRHTQRARKIFNLFMNEMFGDVVIDPVHLVAYMVFRIIGNTSNPDPSPELARYAGTTSMASYQSSEFGPRMSYLRSMNRITFSRADVRSTIEHEQARDRLRNLYRETNSKKNQSKSRAVWFMDEARLSSCLSLDLAGKRDRAIMVILRQSGARVAAICGMCMDFHILSEASPLTLLVPEVKTGERVNYQLIVRLYLDHIRLVFKSNPYMFINKRGKQCSGPDISEMMKRLSLRLRPRGSMS